MASLTITSKGQVTLRKDLLAHIGARPGDRIVVDKLPGGRIAIAADRPGGPISGLFGVLKREGQRALSIEEMNEIIADGWAGKR
jgi:bifunctional DNA-binding transcriptional regulator/antitoxin component of YhaV-PrlF toxin-antitoxin module